MDSTDTPTSTSRDEIFKIFIVLMGATVAALAIVLLINSYYAIANNSVMEFLGRLLSSPSIVMSVMDIFWILMIGALLVVLWLVRQNKLKAQ